MTNKNVNYAKIKMKSSILNRIKKIYFSSDTTLIIDLYLKINTFYLILILVIFCIGCEPEIGGGGSVHIQPKLIRMNEPTEIKLELSVWGEGSKKISKRYSRVQCHYKTDKTYGFEKIDMILQKENDKVAIYTCILPPFRKKGQLEYYFTMMFDGHENRRDESPILIQ